MPETILDIFNNDAFSVISLTDRVNKMPYQPGRAGRLGIFEETGITTTDVAIEEYNGTLNLVPNQPRGGPPNQNLHAKRKLRKLTVPHLPLSDAVYADEVQNIRSFGPGDQLMAVQGEVDRRLMEMNPKLDATVEYGRIGAIKGLILDSDGSTVIYNLFTEFGVSQQTLSFDLGTPTTDLIAKSTLVAADIENELGAAMYDHIHAFCGATFFSDLVAHANVKDAYRYFMATGQNQNPLREDLRYTGFLFGGILWEQYRGSVGGVDFIPATEAYAFPVGGTGLFKTYFAPADFVETVNTAGRPRYVKQYQSDSSGRSVTVEAQTNPLSINLRPRTSIKLTVS